MGKGHMKKRNKGGVGGAGGGRRGGPKGSKNKLHTAAPNQQTHKNKNKNRTKEVFRVAGGVAKRAKKGDSRATVNYKRVNMSQLEDIGRLNKSLRTMQNNHSAGHFGRMSAAAATATRTIPGNKKMKNSKSLATSTNPFRLNKRPTEPPLITFKDAAVDKIMNSKHYDEDGKPLLPPEVKTRTTDEDMDEAIESLADL